MKKSETCPDGYYYEWVGPQEQGPLKPLAGKAVCRKCHPRCKKCNGYGFHEQVTKLDSPYWDLLYSITFFYSAGVPRVRQVQKRRAM